MAEIVITDEDKMQLKAVVLELSVIRKLVDALAEATVNLSDKEFLKSFSIAPEVDLTENELERHEGRLQKQLYNAKKAFSL